MAFEILAQSSRSPTIHSLICKRCPSDMRTRHAPPMEWFIKTCGKCRVEVCRHFFKEHERYDYLCTICECAFGMPYPEKCLCARCSEPFFRTESDIRICMSCFEKEEDQKDREVVEYNKRYAERVKNEARCGRTRETAIKIS